MILLIVGGIGSGKSAFAEHWARTLGREAIRFSCPPWPDRGSGTAAPAAGSDPYGFVWKEMEAGPALAAKLSIVNRESNIFRADRRVIVVDSLSGWQRARIQRAKEAGMKPEGLGAGGAGSLGELLASILAYQGKRIVVSEEATAGLAEDPWERLYAQELAHAIRTLAEESHALYRLTAGLAMEVKGHRVKRGDGGR